jgi:autotransporter-associated beta strand protein
MSQQTWRRWVERLFRQRKGKPVRGPRSLGLERLEERVVPATDTWLGSISGNWNTAGNWSLNRVPIAGDDLVFGSGGSALNRNTVDNLRSGIAFNSVTISAAGYTLGTNISNTLIVDGAINVGTNVGTATITMPVELTPPTSNPQQTITVNLGSTLDIQGQLMVNQALLAATAAKQTLTKAGTGTLQLDGNNTTWTAAFTLASGGGYVIMTNANALGTGAVVSGVPTAGITTINPNSQLQVAAGAGSFTITDRLKINGSGVVGDGALLNVSGNNTWAGNIEMDSDSAFGANVNTTMTISSVISDLGAGHNLTKTGAGTIVFSHLGGNTYRGATTINNGILRIQDPLSLGAGANYTTPQTNTPQSETIVTDNPTDNLFGTLELDYNPAQTPIPLTDPNLLFQNPFLPYNATTNPVVGFQVFNDILVLNGPGYSNLGALYSLNGNNGWDGSVILGSVPPEYDGVAIGAFANTTLMISGIVSDPNRVTTLNKVDPGEVILNDANTYRGGTIVENGALNIRDSQALGTGAATVLDSAVLELEVDSGLDGTPNRTHNRNLGNDSVNNCGPGQEIYVNPGTGASPTFTLSFMGHTTASLNANSTTLASDIQTALNGPAGNNGLLASAGFPAGSAVVTQDGNLYRVIFGGTLVNANIPLMTAAASGGATASVNPIYGLTVSNSLDTFVGFSLGSSGTGITGLGLMLPSGEYTGALDSISGINTYSGAIDLNGTAAIGVQPDPRTAHPLADANYFQWDDSLTVTGDIGNVFGTTGNLIKLGTGDLILPNNNTYGGSTLIQEGWITAQSNQSLGPPNLALPQTKQQYTTIDSGAALHLRPLAAGTSLTLRNNFRITGEGITHPFGLIDQAGAIENLDGDNFLLGIIQLDSIAGIGVEQVGPSLYVPPAPPTVPPLDASQLLVTGDLWDAVGVEIQVIGTTGTFTINLNGFSTGSLGAASVTLASDISTALNGPTGLLAQAGYAGGTATVNEIGATGTYRIIFGGTLIGTNLPLTTTPTFGVVANVLQGTGGGLDKEGSRRLVVEAPGTFTGPVDIQSGVLLAQNDTALGQGNTTNPPTVTVENNASLEFGNSINGESFGNSSSVVSTNGGIQAGIQVWGEHLILNGAGDPAFGDSAVTALASNANTIGAEVQSLTITGQSTGMFTLSFTGIGPNNTVVTDPTIALPANATAAAVQAALDALSNIGGIGGSVNVVQYGNVYQITFGGTLLGYNQQALTGKGTGGAVPVVVTTQDGSTLAQTSPASDPIAPTDNIWRGPITLNSNTTVTAQTNSLLSNPDSRLILAGNIDDSTNASASGSNLTVVGGGEVYLDGVNTFRGSTYVNQGVLTIGSDQALGNTSASEVQQLTIPSTVTSFKLTFAGLTGQSATTATAIPYTGAPGTDALAIQTALNNLSTIGISNASGDATGSVIVQATSTPGVFTVTFKGALNGFQQSPLQAKVVGGTGAITVSETTAGSGGVVVASGASLQLAGSITVPGKPLLIEGSGSTSATQLITLVPPSGGSLTGTFTLSYTGPDTTGTVVTDTTGPLTVTSGTLQSDISSALNNLPNIVNVGGSVTVAPTATGFAVTFGGTLADTNVQLLAVTPTVNSGGNITTQVQQLGSNTIPHVPTQWFQVGPAQTINGQTPGNEPVSGRVTGEAVDPNDSTVMYVATAGGGVWKTIDGGKSWHPIFDAIPEIQTVTVTATSGTFTLSFTGPDITGATATYTTIPLNVQSPTLAQDIQNALDLLPNIGGVGGLVSVTESQTSATFTISFGGSLSGDSLNLITATPTVTGGTVTTNRLEAGTNSQFALYIGAIAIDPNNSNTLYVGTGELDNSSDSYYGTGVYKSTDGGLTWTLMVDTTSTGTPINPFYAMGISSIAVDPANTGTIYVADGYPTTDGVTSAQINAANPGVIQGVLQPGATGQLAGVWRFTPGASNTSGQWFDLTDVISSFRETIHGKQSNPPGTPGPDDDFRLSFPAPPPPPGFIPASPPPGSRNWGQWPWDAQWSDVKFINGTVYAALGTVNGIGNGVGYADNAVYRVDPATLYSTAPVWFIGNPGPKVNQVETITITNATGAVGQDFQLSFNGDKTPNVPQPTDPGFPNYINGNDYSTEIQNDLNSLATIVGGPLGLPGFVTVSPANHTSGTTTVYTVTFGGALGFSPQPLFGHTQTSFLTISVAITTPGGGADSESSLEFPTYVVKGAPQYNGDIKISGVSTPNGGTIYASVQSNVTDPTIPILSGNEVNVYVSTDGGNTWNPVGTKPPEYFNAGTNGEPDGYDNAIYTPDGTKVYIGGGAQNIADPTNANGQLYYSPNGGGSWTPLTVGANGVGPSNAVHAIVGDGQNADGSYNVIVGTDGGIWQLNGTNNSWNDLNSNLADQLISGVSAAQANVNEMVVGSQANGIQYFNGGPIWNETDQTSVAANGPIGPSGGMVYVSPTDPNTVYAVEDNLQQHLAYLYKSTNAGKTWSQVTSLGAILPGLPGALSPGDYPYFPFLVDPLATANGETRLLAGGGLFPGTALQESLDGGTTWQPLTGSPTWPLGQDVTAVAVAGYQGVFQSDPNFPDVTDIGTNVDDPNTIYVSNGTDLLVTKDHGLLWEDRTPGFAANSIIQSITVDPSNRDHVFVVIQGTTGLGSNQVWESTDAGQTWTQIGGVGATIAGLPDVPLWQLVVDPRTQNIFIGTNNGVFESVGGTGTWERYGFGMPNVQVDVLQLDQTTDTLLAGTYGRSVYQLFLDTTSTATVPVSAGVVGLSGNSVWTGPVILGGDPINNTVTVGADGAQGLPNGVTAASVTFVGSISDLTSGSNPTFIKTGNGDVVLQGSSVYGGLTDIQQGTLVADNPQALGSPASQTTVEAGAALGLEADLNLEPVTINGDGISFDGHFTGALRNITGNNTFSGSLTLNPNYTSATSPTFTSFTIGADSGSELTITGQVTGGIAPTSGVGGTAGSVLVKEGTGTIALAGANDYQGSTSVYQGALSAENDSALSTGNVLVLDGAQMQIQTPAGGTSVSVPNALTLSGNGINETGALLDTGGSNTWSGPITFTVLPGFTPYTNPVGTVSLGVTNEQDTLTVSGAIGEAGGIPEGLLEVGNGTVALSNTNTYSGSTEVAGGVLDIQVAGALGNRIASSPSLQTVQQIVTVDANAAPGDSFTVFFGGQSITEPFGSTTAAGLQADLNALLVSEGFTGVNAATVTVTGSAVATTTETNLGAAGTGEVYTVVFNGSLAQTTLPLSAVGTPGASGANVFANASFVATGGVDTVVDGGAQLALGTPGSTNSFTVANDRQVILNGYGPTATPDGALYNLAGNNTWSGPVFLNTTSGVGAASTPSPTSLTLSGTTTPENGSYLDNVGAGTVIFPANSQYTGSQMLITDGTTQVDTNSTFGGIVLNGGTLSGTGTVAGVTSSNPISGSGGTVDPGDNFPTEAIGTVNSKAAVVLNSTDQVYVDLSVPAGTNNDIFNVTAGGIYLGNATLTGLVDPQVGLNDTFTIITTEPNGVNGVFAGVSDPGNTAGGTIQTATDAYVQGEKFVVNYYNDHVTLTRVLANVTLGLSASPTSSVYGQDDQFVVTVVPEPQAPSPTGNILFTVTDPTGATTQYSIPITPAASPSTNGIATLDVAARTGMPLMVGTYTVEASFNGVDSHGNTTYNPATATPNPLEVVVSQAGTTTALTAVPTLPVYGQNIVLTATVASQVGNPTYGLGSPESGTQTPTGTVSFYDTPLGGSTVLLGTVNLPAGTSGTSATAVFNTSSLASLLTAGNHTFTAIYNGDTNYVTSTSSGIGRSIKQDGTTVSVGTSQGTAVAGQAGITFTATVTASAPGGGYPTGTVTFTDGSLVLGTGTLTPSGNSSVATYTTTAGQLPAAMNAQTITATYTGDSNFTGNSGTTSETVNKDNTSTSVVSSLPGGSVWGQPVTFTATVSANSPGSGTPTGYVTFFAGSTQLNSTPVPVSTTNNVTTASYTTTAFQLAVGAGQTIKAVYSGDSNFNTSQNTTTQTVAKAGTTTTVKSSVPTGAVYGQAIQLTANVFVTAPGAGNPTGTVTFKLGSATLGTTNLGITGGVYTAILVTSVGQLTVGSNQVITATYNGDTDFASSSGTTFESVNKDSSTTTVTSSAPSGSVAGQSVTFTAVVAANSPGTGYPTGSVDFTIGNVTLGSGVLHTVNGVTSASYTTGANQLPVGTSTITATYNGDGNFLSSSGTTSQPVQDGTTTTLASSGDSVYGEPVTFTATITPTQGAGSPPTGTVTFTLGGTTLGTGTVGTVGGVTTATLTTTPFQLAVGANQTVTATYSGDSVFFGSVGSVDQNVNPAPTATTLFSSAPSSNVGQAVILTAQVATVAPGAGNPTGSVNFMDGSTVLGTATLNGGVATFQTNFATAGTHTLTATYTGDTNDAASTSASVSQKVSGVGTRASTVTVKSSQNPSVQSQPVTFTAVVRDAGATPALNPTGTVNFFSGTTLLGLGTLSVVSAGVTVATFTTSALGAGSNTIVAVYNGNPTFALHASAAITQTVNPAAVRTSSTSLVSSLNPSTFGQSVAFTATVKDTGSGAAQTPTGTVQFMDGTTVLGTATLSASSTGVAVATFTTGSLAVGSHSITAVYEGNATFAVGNPSAVVKQVVKQGASGTTITSSLPNGSVYGQSVTFTATVAPAAGGGTPTGTVTFYIGGVAQTPVNLTTVNGVTKATFTTKALPLGGTSVYAVYSGDSNETTSTSATIVQDVNQASSAGTITASTLNSNTSVTFTATITAKTPGSGVPTGTVSFYVDGKFKGTVTLSGGKAGLTLSSGLPVGTHTVQIVYSGDTDFLSSTATKSLTFAAGRGT